MNQALRRVIKYFLAYLVMLRSNLDHAVVTALSTQAAIHHWRRSLSACVHGCRLAVDILNIIFSHALSICRLVD